jgi:hypothetical protein
VAALTFAPGFPRVSDVVTAARAASRLSDPRLTQVFDADDSGERAYVVSEWVSGETLQDMLAAGPVDPERAVALVLEAAEALTTAHAAGLAHLRVTPSTLMWTTGGTVKVAGLGVEAVLSATHSDNPALADTQGLARLLYAALTGYWPGDEVAATTLPHAPMVQSRPCPPRGIRPGIPAALDEVICRTLQIAHAGSTVPITTPAAFVEALMPLPKTPLPFISLGGTTPPALLPLESPTITPVERSRRPPPPPPNRTTAIHHRSPGSGRPSRSVLVAAAVVVVVVVVLGAFLISRLGGSPRAHASNDQPTQHAVSNVTTLTPTAATGISVPMGSGSPDKHYKANTMAVLTGTGTWHTEYYFGSDYGRLQVGDGIMFTMPGADKISKVTVTMPPGTGGQLQVRVGKTPDRDAMATVGTVAGSGTVTVTANDVPGQYVLLWFSSLPHLDGMPAGNFEAAIQHVVIYGTSG